MTALVRQPLRVFVLYRPRLPATRAQSIQVLGTAHGLAQLGCHVTLLADPPRDRMPVDELPTVEQVLRWYQLAPVEGLDLRLCPTSIPWAMSVWFRKHALLWIWESARHHPERSVILARAKRYVDEYLALPVGPPVVLEAHEVDSEIAREKGDDVAPWIKLEKRVLCDVDGVITNCQGTLDLLRRVHSGALPDNQRVVWNATNPHRVRNHRPGASRVVGYAGSLRPFKGLGTLLQAAERFPQGTELHLLGGTQAELDALGPLPPCVTWLGDQPYAQVPEIVSRWHVAVLPLDDDLFGRRLTNPLKLWDYRAIGVPLVAADLPTLREVLRDDEPTWYTPRDPASLAQSVSQALQRPRRPRRSLRSWRTRAEEILPVLEAALA